MKSQAKSEPALNIPKNEKNYPIFLKGIPDFAFLTANFPPFAKTISSIIALELSTLPRLLAKASFVRLLWNWFG
jgi:hypothetical protein